MKAKRKVNYKEIEEAIFHFSFVVFITFFFTSGGHIYIYKLSNFYSKFDNKLP